MNSRRKGHDGERELCRLLRDAGWPEAGRNHEQAERGGADTVRGPRGIVFEVKRRKAKVDVPKAMRQAEAAADREEAPVVAHRVDRQPWMATISLPWLVRLSDVGAIWWPFKDDSEPLVTLALADLLSLLADSR